uniref:PWWP domain containing 2B n=1 Tax=Molossus molossus TaxID=27622 RepID=A0A7J8DR48_MOLMO|nr:PWWP domain containing 2B [Molossus molossus]
MEPRAGCRLPVRVEQVVNGALLVTVSCGQRSFAGILLDCTKKSFWRSVSAEHL